MQKQNNDQNFSKDVSVSDLYNLADTLNLKRKKEEAQRKRQQIQELQKAIEVTKKSLDDVDAKVDIATKPPEEISLLRDEELDNVLSTLKFTKDKLDDAVKKKNADDRKLIEEYNSVVAVFNSSVDELISSLRRLRLNISGNDLHQQINKRLGLLRDEYSKMQQAAKSNGADHELHAIKIPADIDSSDVPAFMKEAKIKENEIPPLQDGKMIKLGEVNKLKEKVEEKHKSMTDFLDKIKSIENAATEIRKLERQQASDILTKGADQLKKLSQNEDALVSQIGNVLGVSDGGSLVFYNKAVKPEDIESISVDLAKDSDAKIKAKLEKFSKYKENISNRKNELDQCLKAATGLSEKAENLADQDKVTSVLISEIITDKKVFENNYRRLIGDVSKGGLFTRIDQLGASLEKGQHSEEMVNLLNKIRADFLKESITLTGWTRPEGMNDQEAIAAFVKDWSGVGGWFKKIFRFGAATETWKMINQYISAGKLLSQNNDVVLSRINSDINMRSIIYIIKSNKVNEFLSEVDSINVAKKIEFPIDVIEKPRASANVNELVRKADKKIESHVDALKGVTASVDAQPSSTLHVSETLSKDKTDDEKKPQEYAELKADLEKKQEKESQSRKAADKVINELRVQLMQPFKDYKTTHFKEAFGNYFYALKVGYAEYIIKQIEESDAKLVEIQSYTAFLRSKMAGFSGEQIQKYEADYNDSALKKAVDNLRSIEGVIVVEKKLSDNTGVQLDDQPSVGSVKNPLPPVNTKNPMSQTENLTEAKADNVPPFPG